MDHSETDVNGEARSKCRCYVIQTVSAQEDRLIYLMQQIIPSELMEDVFVPRREMNRKVRGRWQRIQELMFPGYVFILTPDPDTLFQKLKQVPRLSKLLQGDRFEFVPLSEQEQNFAERIGRRRGDHIFGISKVGLDPEVPYRKGDKVRILEGDLKDFAGEIVGLDLRKRKAIIRTEMFGNCSVDVHVGIEIIALKDYMRERS